MRRSNDAFPAFVGPLRISCGTKASGLLNGNGMNRNQIRELLRQVANGQATLDQAESRLVSAMRSQPVENLSFATVDHHRQIRCGFPEVIYGEGKTPDQLAAIFDAVQARGAGCLATRVNDAQAELVLRSHPDADYDKLGRTLWKGAIPDEPAGRVIIVTAGTSDLPVGREAYTTAKVMGAAVELIADVGVAGLHRLLQHEPKLAASDCIVVVAGMEGALPSVVGGLVDCPVIAVPTSVGYGASFGGVAALLGMLSSCASNVAVVNIDGGFCGGYVAALIATRTGSRRPSSIPDSTHPPA